MKISPCIPSCENEQNIDDKLMNNLEYSQEMDGTKGLSETGITVGREGKFRTATVRARREVRNWNYCRIRRKSQNCNYCRIRREFQKPV